MIRVSKDMKAALKHICNIEGRTLEWLTNDAFEFYIMNFDEIQKRNRKEALAVKEHIVKEGIELGILKEGQPSIKKPDGNWAVGHKAVADVERYVSTYTNKDDPVTIPDSQEYEKSIKFCKHGNVIGLCKKGCVK